MHKWGYQKIFNQKLLEKRVKENNQKKKILKKQIFIDINKPNENTNLDNNNLTDIQ
jgi:hypothetical protein